MKIAVIGATGLVGRTILEVLQESRIFHETELIPVASHRSYGDIIRFSGDDYKIRSIGEAIEEYPDIAIFSVGSEVSRDWAERFAENNIIVIDNSSAWRKDPEKPLIVPEINAEILTRKDRIISNPNCSTIQMVMPLAPLHRKYKIRRIIVATYQSVSGTGYNAVNQLNNEREGREGDMAYPHQIDLNVIPHGGDFDDNGYTAEENKLLFETQKILDDTSIRVSATVARVPVMYGHSMALNIEFEDEFQVDEVREILSETDGVILEDDFKNLSYPMPINAAGKDEVFVGRIRRDFSAPNSLNMWIVADNLRKGAATNAVQIAEYIVINKLL